MSITLELLLSFITAIAPLGGATITDLCDIVDAATGVPLMCRAHPDGAPIYDGKVCCDGDSCVASSRSCDAESTYYCHLGERLASDEVRCYFEVPYYCEVFPCAPGIQAQPLAMGMCCNQGICWHHTLGSNDCELGDLFWCSNGVSNPDGTVTCLDDE
jgi:hypothetical protein